MSEHLVNKEKRKQQILSSAKTLFLEQGVQATSISQIARHAKIVKSLVFYYFPNKDAILEELSNSLCEEQVIAVHKKMGEADDDFFSPLLILVDSYYDIFTHRQTFDEYEKQSENSLVISFHKRFLEETLSLREELVRQGRELGYMKYDNAELKLIVIVEGVFSLLRTSIFNKETLLVIFGEMLHLPLDELFQRKHLLVHIGEEEVAH